MAASCYVAVASPNPCRVAMLSHIRRQTPRFRPFYASRVRASAAVPIEAKPDLISDGKVYRDRSVLACPICYDPLRQNTEMGLTALQCPTCKKVYSKNEVFHDLTITSSSNTYSEVKPLITEFFRLPLVSFLYERGWRQSFTRGGYPGEEKEFEMAKGYLEPTVGGTLLDASCGSGLFSRRFAKSGMYPLVVAMDFSENMLRQCYEFMEQDAFPKENLLLVRADISRLPFLSNSMDAVHAGAAIHCWPSPSSAVAEITRVLRPGGVFVATTAVLDGLPVIPPVLVPLRQYSAQISGSHYFLERELEDLCRACGLVDFKCTRNGLFIIVSATKPS